MEELKSLVDIIHDASNITYVIDDNSIEFETNTNLDSITSLGFSAEIVQRTKTRISSNQTEVTIFIDNSDFKNRVKEADFEKYILILNDINKSYLFDPKGEITYRNFIKETSYFSIQNVLYYYKLIRFLSTQEHKEDQAFYFVDYFNWDNRSIVFTSLKKEGKLVISFPLTAPDIQYSINLKKKVERFVQCFDQQNRHLPKFLKGEFFNFLSKENKEERLIILIEKIDEIISISEQNHELYLSDLTLDNLKKDYIDHKEKYYQQFREILGKITNQIISLPLAITASVFATYKVSDTETLYSRNTLLLILGVFAIYSVFMSMLVRLYKQDLEESKDQSNIDFKKIKSSSFFSKYPSEIAIFEKMQDRVAGKIKNLTVFIAVYYFSLLITNSIFIQYIIAQISGSMAFRCIIPLFIFISGLIIWILLERRQRKLQLT